MPLCKQQSDFAPEIYATLGVIILCGLSQQLAGAACEQSSGQLQCVTSRERVAARKIQ
jgi:hypothetical protein